MSIISDQLTTPAKNDASAVGRCRGAAVNLGPHELGDTWGMTIFFGLVKYVGIGVIALIGVLVLIAAIASIVITVSPDLPAGLLQSN